MMALASTSNGQVLSSVFKKISHVPTSSRTCSLPSHVIQRSACCFQCTGRSVNNIYLRWKEVEQRYSSPRGLLMCRVQQHDSTSEENKENISQATLIWRAIKLPIYSVALIPLTVGSAAAYLQTGLFSARRYFMLLASSVFIITWLNLRCGFYCHRKFVGFHRICCCCCYLILVAQWKYFDVHSPSSQRHLAQESLDLLIIGYNQSAC